MPYKKLLGYQIIGDNNELPKGLYSFQLFKTMTQAIKWSDKHEKDLPIGGVITPIYICDVEEPTFIEVFDEKDKNFIKGIVSMTLSSIFSDEYDNQAVIENIIDDVIKDVEETADVYYNDSDVRIAVARVLKNRLGIE